MARPFNVAHRNGRPARLRRPAPAGEVTLDQLRLQRECRRRDHDGLVAGVGVQQRRHQVGQRLAGPRARLHEQMLTRSDRRLDRLRHLDLTGAFAAADGVDRGGQQLAHACGPVRIAHQVTLPSPGRSSDRLAHRPQPSPSAPDTSQSPSTAVNV